jgi:hypothetical protein
MVDSSLLSRLKICVSATLKKKGIHTSTDLFKALYNLVTKLNNSFALLLRTVQASNHEKY